MILVNLLHGMCVYGTFVTLSGMLSSMVMKVSPLAELSG
jgi:hypothetical protein